MVGFDVIFDLMLSIDGSGGAVSAPSWVVYFALLRDADSLAVSAHLPVSVASNNLCCTRRSRKGSGVRRGGGKSIKEISAADPAAASERRQTGLPPFYLIDTTLLWLINTLRDKKKKIFWFFCFFLFLRMFALRSWFVKSNTSAIDGTVSQYYLRVLFDCCYTYLFVESG